MNRIIAVLALFYFQYSGITQVIYVNHLANGQNNGTSWPNAFKSLQSALYVAKQGDAIWVAKGIYSAYIQDSTYSFKLKSGVKLYGGFNGTEAQLTQRNWEENKTEMTGYAPPFGFSLSNVIYCENTDSNTTINGFTIKEGYAILNGIEYCWDSGVANESPCHGAGLYAYSEDTTKPTNLTIANCVFYKNIARYGGGISLNFPLGAGQVRIQNCRFEENAGNVEGGAIYAFFGSGGKSRIEIDQCVFQNNGANAAAAVDINNFNPHADIAIRNSSFLDNHGIITGAVFLGNYGGGKIAAVENCLFQSNKAGLNQFEPGRGGALIAGRVKLDRCLFIGNHGYKGGAAELGNARVSNCLFAKNYSTSEAGAVKLRGLNYFTNCSFVNNFCTQNGGAFYSGHEGFWPDTIINCLFWNNRAAVSGDFIADKNIYGYFDLFIDRCLIDADSCEQLQDAIDITDPYTFACGNHILWNIAPQLRDTIIGDYRLSGCSPALNAGDSTWVKRFGLVYDLAGNLRMLEGFPDIGSYETETFQPQIAGTDISCFGNQDGVATVLPAGGYAPYQYTWNTGTNEASTQIQAPGEYSVTILDADECSDTLYTSVAEPLPLVVAAESYPASAITSKDGAIALQILTGGVPPYTIRWDTGDTTSQLSGISAGMYQLTVSDANGCDTVLHIEVKVIVDSPEHETLLFNVYLLPNPFLSVLAFSAPVEPWQRVDATLFDLTGRVAARTAWRGPHSDWHLPDLPAGMYQYQLRSDDGRAAWGKVVKQ